MVITKDQMARDIAERSGYYLKDVKAVLSIMDDLIKDYFAQVTDDEEVSIQIVEGCKIGCSIVPERQRRNPKTQEDVICAATCKPFAKFSGVFRDTIQKQYDDKKAE